MKRNFAQVSTVCCNAWLKAVGLLVMAGIAAAGGKAAGDVRAGSHWIVLQGSIDQVRKNRFLLDTRTQVVPVAMGDADTGPGGMKLLQGASVTVAGRVGADSRPGDGPIEASSVYIPALGTTFFSPVPGARNHGGPADRKPGSAPSMAAEVRGTVRAVSDSSFTLATGSRELRVDMSGVPGQPLRSARPDHLRPGDRVKVFGRIHYERFAAREILASGLVRYGYGQIQLCNRSRAIYGEYQPKEGRCLIQ